MHYSIAKVIISVTKSQGSYTRFEREKRILKLYYWNFNSDVFFEICTGLAKPIRINIVRRLTQDHNSKNVCCNLKYFVALNE